MQGENRTMDYPLRRGMLDSHFHGLIMQERGMDVSCLIDELEGAGFAGGIDVSTTPEDFAARSKLYASRPQILLSLGIHPGQCGRPDIEEQLSLLARRMADPEARPRIAAVGELGLDWYRGRTHRHEQIRVFEAQLDLAAAEELPVIIHNRDAEDDILASLTGRAPVSGVMHCFSSDQSFAEKCLDLGLHISFAGNVTYKNSEAIRDAARFVPDDRLLLETDSPFLAPQAVRGRPNQPGHVSHTYEYIAELRGTAVERLIEIVGQSFQALFGTAQ